jgi:hypothetical protein
MKNDSFWHAVKEGMGPHGQKKLIIESLPLERTKKPP